MASESVTCPVCGREGRTLLKDGTIRQHVDPSRSNPDLSRFGVLCDASRMTPEQAATYEPQPYRATSLAVIPRDPTAPVYQHKSADPLDCQGCERDECDTCSGYPELTDPSASVYRHEALVRTGAVVDPIADLAALDELITSAPADYPGLPLLRRRRAELVAELTDPSAPVDIPLPAEPPRDRRIEAVDADGVVWARWRYDGDGYWVGDTVRGLWAWPLIVECAYYERHTLRHVPVEGSDGDE